METKQQDYRRISEAIRFLVAHQQEQPSLDSVAAHVGVSSSLLQRRFSALVGISPKRFLQALTVQRAGRLLEHGSVLDTALAAGLSGPSRLHDHFVVMHAMSPGEYKSRGANVQMSLGVAQTVFGSLVVAVTERGICALQLSDEPEKALAEMHDCWPQASKTRDDEKAGALAAVMFADQASEVPLSLVVNGTNFQLQVWQALLNIPRGEVSSYSGLAAMMGRPQATRAVASAVAANPVAWLIPCHRVIRATGAIGEYRWGSERKQALLAWEQSVNS
ncbi:MAG: methylated-DNA--[protein]-cysteine S-methyltransferase [Pseudomonadales bacterium]